MSEKNTRGRASKVDLLPPNIKTQLAMMLRDKQFSQTEILQEINDLIRDCGLDESLYLSRSGLSGGTVSFNEGESLLTVTKAFLQAQPKIVEFAEVADPKKAAETAPDTVSYAETDDPARIELDRKARAYMKQHNVDYATAISAVM